MNRMQEKGSVRKMEATEEGLTLDQVAKKVSLR